MNRYVARYGIPALVVALVIVFTFALFARANTGSGCGGTVLHDRGTVVTGTPGDDVIHSNQCSPRGAQMIYALAGADRVWGGKGADVEYGGPGNDILHSYHAGGDVLYGGAGRDVCVIARGAATDAAHCEIIRYRDAQGNGR